jgi:secreted trypsin-like serine protease
MIFVIRRFINVLAFFMASAHFANAAPYILHGVNVGPSDPIASTTVAIISQGAEGTALCTGSLIATDLVVTAGHCVGPESAKMTIAFETNLHRKARPRLAKVLSYARPRSYGHFKNDRDMGDIALIRFAGGLPQGYQVAQLLDDSARLKSGEQVVLAGYGVSDGNPEHQADDAGAGILRKVKVRIERASYGHTEVVMDQSDGHGACHGDSGGPAFLQTEAGYLLFGVTSRGLSNGPDDCSQASVYTNILAQSEFVRRAAAGLRSKKNLAAD